MIPMDEEDAIKRILRHHGVPVTHKLVADLSALLAWVHEVEQNKTHFDGTRHHPPLLMNELSKMGIYGKEAIDKAPTVEAAAAQKEWDEEHSPA